MKKVILIFTMLMLFTVTIKAKEPGCGCNIGDNLCSNCENAPLFNICKGNNCTTIDTDSINDNAEYRGFEIRDREIYLNNSEISLRFDNIWSLLDYKIHITGTNKIYSLINYNTGKGGIDEEAYPELYTKEYIPFSVEGDGTLEIEKINIVRVNQEGEIYYNNWHFNPPYLTTENYRINAQYRVFTREEYCSGPICRSDCENVAVPLTRKDIISYFVDHNYMGSYPFKKKGSRCTVDEAAELDADSLPSNINDIFTLLRLNGIDSNGVCARGMTDEECKLAKLNYILDADILTADNKAYGEAQMTRDFAEEYITTDLNRSFTESGSYLLSPRREEPVGSLEEITTTQVGSITFTSSEAFDSNYHLGVDDITESITDTDASKVEAKTDKTLIKLYDINMLDKDNKVVDMGNGTYTIKVALSDLLKKYNEYQVVYINENSVELIPARVEDEYIVFNTTHLSKYGIVGLEKTTKKDIITGEDITNPKTADTIVTYSLILTSLAVSIVLVTLRIKKLKGTN